MRSDKGRDKFLSLLNLNSTILDVGSGAGAHAKVFESKEHFVDTVDFFDYCTFKGNYMDLNIEKKYDAIWCSHCLEHQLNPNNFLIKIKSNTKENGWIAITVPPLKHEIVSGHMTLWNAGLLLYNLVITGVNCNEAMIKKYDYNITVITKNKSFEVPKLKYDADDLITLKDYFPSSIIRNAKGWFNGDIESLNW
jgi:2-polyprenyl-3-methyl-5-hydroxy-6-metoxy-1,4-benzoquinol methylase